MAVARTATITGNRATGSSTTLGVTATCNTATTGTDHVAVVIVVQSVITNTTDTTVTVTYGGVTMTNWSVAANPVDFGATTSRSAIGYYTLNNPPTGSQNVVATSGGTGTKTAIAVGGGVYSGCGPVGPVVTATSRTIAVPSVSGGMVIAGTTNDSALSAPTQTSLYSAGSSVTGTGDYILVQDAAGTGSDVTFSCSGTDATPGSIGISLAPIPATTSPGLASIGPEGSDSGTAVSVPVPPGVAVGDTVLIFAALDTSTSSFSVVPSGFVEQPDSPVVVTGSQTMNARVYGKIATAADTGTYDFTLASAVFTRAFAARFTGTPTSGSPLNVTASAINTTPSNTTSAVTDTTTVDNCLWVWFVADWNFSDYSAVSGWRKVFDGYLSAAYILAQPAQGSSGSLTAAFTGSAASSAAWLGALKPVTTVRATVTVTNVAVQRASLW